MRMNVGKRVGGVYVGTSLDAKAFLKGVLYFFTWPFLLCYFIFIWPFVKLHQHSKNKKSHKMETTPKTVEVGGTSYTMMPAEARPIIPGLKNQYEDCMKILQSTKDPDVFFGKLDQCEDALKQLSAACIICESSNNNEGVLQDFTDSKDKLTEDFIMRYAKDTRRKIYELSTSKGKLNRAEVFKKILNEFSDNINDQNWSLVKSEYEKLKELAQ